MSRRWIVILLTSLTLSVVLARPQVAGARTWYVTPEGTGDVPTIAAALDSAVLGDDVLLAPGTYFEHDLQLPDGITLHSEGGRDVTTIDGEGLGGVIAGESLVHETTIAGLTIRGGNGSVFGGGITAINVWLVVRDCALRENAGGRGGGIGFNYSAAGPPVTIMNTVFEGNTATSQGGAVYGWYAIIDGEAVGEWSPFLIDGCDFTGNSAPSTGGAVHIEYWNVIVRGSSFEDNSCFAGGAVFLTAYDEMQVADCSFRNNQGQQGGALHITYMGVDQAEITGCLLAGNSADEGGAIYSFYSRFLVSSCTLVGNSANVGGGIYTEDADPPLENTIIAFGTGGGGIFADGSVHVPAVSCCDVFGNAGGDYTGGITDQTGVNGNLSLDPFFCGPAIGDYALDAASPCLDAPGCGLMGAFGQGCDGATTSVKNTPEEPASWGELKSRFER